MVRKSYRLAETVAKPFTAEKYLKKIGLGKDDYYFWKQIGKALLCTYTVFGAMWLFNETSPLGWWTLKPVPKEEKELAHLYQRINYPYPGDEEAMTDFIAKGGMIGTMVNAKGAIEMDQGPGNYQKQLQKEKFDQEANKLWLRMKNEVVQELREKVDTLPLPPFALTPPSGRSIFLAVNIVIVVTALSDCKLSLLFQNLNEEKQNIQLEVVRGGRRIEISIFEIVVGVPADGVLISSHSLAIEESSMTGESKIVHKDQNLPLFMLGCQVADGYGTMLVTGVGINTEWGLLMASISDNNGEETPLQVGLNGVATFICIVGLVFDLRIHHAYIFSLLCVRLPVCKPKQVCRTS